MPLLESRQVRAAELVSASADAQHPALIDATGRLTYGELADRVAVLAAGLPAARHGRRLVHVPLAAQRDLVLGYLAVLAAGHVPLVTPPEHRAITAVYPPDLWLRPDGTFEPAGPAADEPRHLLHPELALLLSTSGSTGSPKLVRLSHTNLVSNADAIVAALSITPADRAVTSLPLHYCFGLSVLHAQLRAGAATVLRPGSVTDPGLADELRRHRVTMLAATPHLVDLLDGQGVLDRLPTLRLLAQAGGALPAERVRQLAARGRAAGWGLAVMYGQTEATARMAVLPPELAQRHPDAVGWPVAGSAFRLDPAPADTPDATAGRIGELVFTGPGVMLGYAEHPADLALGRTQTELRTGDLARIDADGLVRVVGRRADFVKVMGIRIDLGQVERVLRARGVPCLVTGRDDQLQVTHRRGAHSCEQVRKHTAQVSGLGPSVISVRPVDELPLLPNGKPDRRRSAELHAGEVVAATRPELTAAVVAVLEPLLGPDGVDLDLSFVELGGDSFSHVRASVGLTRLLGDLPVDWHHRPVRELLALAARAPGARRPAPLVRRVETTVVLRGAAVLAICGSHVGLFRLAGGAHILLAVAGFLFARYVLPAPTTAQRARRAARIALGVAAPAVTVAAVMLVGFGSAHWSNVVLAHWLVRPHQGNIFWFVEAYLVLIVGAVAVLAAPRVGAAYRGDPWRVAMLALAVSLVPRYLVPAWFDGPVRGLPGTVAWLFVAGVAMAVADGPRRRLATAAVAAPAAYGFFAGQAERNLMIMAGLVLLALVPAVPIPRPLVRPLAALASASLHIYLVQFQVFRFFDTPIVEFTAAIAVGLAFCALSNHLLRRLPRSLPVLAVVRRRVAAPHLVREDMTCVDARS